MAKKIDLTKKRRHFLNGAVKSIDTEKRTVRAYASTKGWDRYGERFEPDAFKDGMKNYLANPVVLFGHNYWDTPIGKTIAHEFDDQGLILTMEFADTPKAKEVFDLYKDGFMSAFSVGFRPIEVAWEERSPGVNGLVYKRAELLENSAVPVPANPEAVVMKGLGGQTRQVSGDLLRELMSAGWEQRGEDEEVVEDHAPAQEDPAPAAVADPATVEEPAKVEDPAPAAADPVPEESAEPKALSSTKPDLGESLKYLIALAKTVKAKVTDEGQRGLLIQANNLFRELVYGPHAPKLEDNTEDGPMTDGQKAAMVAEYEVLSQQIMEDPNASAEDLAELERVGAIIEKTISRA